MKKLVSLILILCLVLGCMAFASAETQTASARGFASDVTVEVTEEPCEACEEESCEGCENAPAEEKAEEPCCCEGEEKPAE